MRHKLVCVMLACALIPFAFGCASTGSSAPANPESADDFSTGIPLAPDFRIADIPVPAGFEFNREHSFVFQNSRIDVGRIQYIGKESVVDVAQFYIDEMPRYDWVLLNVTEHSTITMYFEKEGEACSILLTPKGRGAIVEASFFPRPLQPEPIRYEE